MLNWVLGEEKSSWLMGVAIGEPTATRPHSSPCVASARTWPEELDRRAKRERRHGGHMRVYSDPGGMHRIPREVDTLSQTSQVASEGAVPRTRPTKRPRPLAPARVNEVKTPLRTQPEDYKSDYKHLNLDPVETKPTCPDKNVKRVNEIWPPQWAVAGDPVVKKQAAVNNDKHQLVSASLAPEKRWRRLGSYLFFESNQAFDLKEQARNRVVDWRYGIASLHLEVNQRLSMVVTTGREETCEHKELWEAFLAHEWEDKELVVVDCFTTSEPSKFLRQKAIEDPRLVHVCLRVDNLSTTLAHKVGVVMATGEYVMACSSADLAVARFLGTGVQAVTPPQLRTLVMQGY